MFHIVQDDYPQLPKGISQAVQDFLSLCFKKEPILRSSAEKLLQHPWLQNPSNSHLTHKEMAMISTSEGIVMYNYNYCFTYAFLNDFF